MSSNSDKQESLFELAAVLGHQEDFQEILRIISTKAAALLDAEVASIMMINPGTQNTIKTVIKEGREEGKTRHKLLQNNMIGWAMKHRQSFFSEDVRRDARFQPNIAARFSAGSAMCVPLLSGGRAIGFLLAINKSGGAVFRKDELALLEKMAAICAPFLDNNRQLQHLFREQPRENELLKKYQQLGLLGKSQAFIELLKSVEAAARCDVRVLLQGKSGTGKEKIARAIHKLSSRREKPFIAVDCSAIPENLIESELFGHLKGAFTGASFTRKGLFEEADSGTLFMDEIANLPYDMQAKLLRVLQEGEIRVIGSNKPKKVDVRIISAASSSLRTLVDSKNFREDLFYRLHVYPIDVPPLNERDEDIPLLAEHFLKRFAAQQQKLADSFHRDLLRFMQQRNWPGNIRELENFVERLVTLAAPGSKILDRSILPPEFVEEAKSMSSPESSTDHKSLDETLSETEEQILRRALEKHNWNQSQAARSLNISERMIRYRMAKLGIRRPPGK